MWYIYKLSYSDLQVEPTIKIVKIIFILNLNNDCPRKFLFFLFIRLILVSIAQYSETNTFCRYLNLNEEELLQSKPFF